ncbi:hypothetical protein [Escherichia coli]|uniref:hypothetical protein n=1 Tax=Escherichia coli TaxID=562 RepID=UPI00398529E5
MVIEYWLSNNAGGSVTANGIAGKVTIRQLAIFKNYIKWRHYIKYCQPKETPKNHIE